MKATKIDWCDATINPVVGCLRNCPYCYARKQNARFGWVKDFTKPEFFPHRLGQLKDKHPKAIFMDSMSDIAFWSEADNTAAGQVLKAMLNNPQHNYIFLTKTVNKKILFPTNIAPLGRGQFIFNGYSVDRQSSLDNFEDIFDFLSIEPILEPITLPFKCSRLRQVIIGAETGKRKERVIPRREWILSLCAQAAARGLRVFMKESLSDLMGADFRQDELIWR